MARIALYKDNYADSTVVSNLFIDEYMKDANDAQLKVYFYLLRMLNAEQAISVSGIADKFNPEKGRPYRYDTNPDNAQQVAPSNESRTQVAVNNDGKTNEATKNLREPLQKGQTNPKDARQQQQQEKPQKKTGKGMKM